MEHYYTTNMEYPTVGIYFHADGFYEHTMQDIYIEFNILSSMATIFSGQRLSDRKKNTQQLCKHRYIHDIFLICAYDEYSLHDFKQYINNFHSTIKFIMNYSAIFIQFLNIGVHQQ